MAKTVEKDHPEPTCPHGHSKVTSIHRATIKENLKTGRKDLTQLKI